MPLIYDLADTQELTGFVRGLQLELDNNTFLLSQFLPNVPIDDIEFRANRGTLRDQDAAQVRSWDTESPIGNRQSIERILGELPPISKKIRLGEEERLRRRALERGNNQGLVDAIYDDAANMARAVAARIEMFRGEALETGSLVINENGVTQTIPFGRKAAHTVTAATLWTNGAGDPIADMRTWVETYIATNGGPPALGLTSTAVISDLLRNSPIRTLLGSQAGTPGLVTRDQVTQVLAAFGLPPLVAYDVNVRVNGAVTRVTSNNKVIFLPQSGEPLGATFSGTTAEALELAEANQIANDQVAGMVAVVDKTYDPVATWTKAAAIALPVLVNPDLTFTATVRA